MAKKRSVLKLTMQVLIVIASLGFLSQIDLRLGMTNTIIFFGSITVMFALIILINKYIPEEDEK